MREGYQNGQNWSFWDPLRHIKRWKIFFRESLKHFIWSLSTFYQKLSSWNITRKVKKGLGDAFRVSKSQNWPFWAFEAYIKELKNLIEMSLNDVNRSLSIFCWIQAWKYYQKDKEWVLGVEICVKALKMAKISIFASLYLIKRVESHIRKSINYFKRSLSTFYWD